MTLRGLDSSIAYDALVTVRHGPQVGLPSEITYSAIAIGTLDQIAIQSMPPTRRVSDGAKVVAAEPGDWCKIVIRGGEVFLFVAEGIKFKECSTERPDSTPERTGFLRRIFG
jgi:hypothetical protein